MESKFKVGDIIRLTRTSGMAAKVGALAKVTGYDGDSYILVEWDRSTQSNNQQDGHYYAWDFESVNNYKQLINQVGTDCTNQTNPKDLMGIQKVPIHLVPPASMIYEASAFEHGASKYGKYNWRDKKVICSIYIDAAFRHLLAYLDGQDIDEDSGLSHLAHLKATIGVIIDAKENNCLIDDRPTKGNAPEILNRLKKEK